jgi:hypothetical protein
VAALPSGVAWPVRPEPPPPQREPVTVLITDLENRTADRSFSGSAEQALAMGLEAASFVSVYPQRDARVLVAQFATAPAGRITVNTGQLVARREGVKGLVAGLVVPESGAIASRRDCSILAMAVSSGPGNAASGPERRSYPPSVSSPWKTGPLSASRRERWARPRRLPQCRSMR